MNDPKVKESWEYVFHPPQISLADNTTYYQWGPAKAYTTSLGQFVWHIPTRNMILTSVTFMREGTSVPSTEGCTLAINERYCNPNVGTLPIFLRNIIITKNLQFSFTPTPLGTSQRWDDLFIPMIVGRYYALRLDVPAMATNPTLEATGIVLRGVYEA